MTGRRVCFWVGLGMIVVPVVGILVAATLKVLERPWPGLRDWAIALLITAGIFGYIGAARWLVERGTRR